MDVDVKKYAINLMRDAGSFKASREYLCELEVTARHEIAKLGGNVILESVIDSLSAAYK
jgi:geranylgeranyl diphosphate synthase type 3